MAEPVKDCGKAVEWCSAEDQEVARALSRNNARHGGTPLPSSITPSGKSVVEVRRERDRPSAEAKRLLSKLAEGLMKSALTGSVVEQLAERLLKSRVGTVYNGVKQVTEVHKIIVSDARETATKVDRAVSTDAMNLSVLRIIQTQLDPAYVKTAMRERLFSEELAKGLDNELVSLPPQRFKELLERLNRQAAEGVAAARAKNIRSEADLGRALASDSEFAECFQEMTAFRHGVRSVIHATSR
jgi:hypothetical protein